MTVATATALFDLDGTLTDPGDGFVNCVSHALSKLNCLAHTPAEIRMHVGPPLEETLGKLLGDDVTKVSAAVALYRERYGTVGYLENVVYPDVRETLEELKRGGIVLFVATSKPTVFAKQIVDHFGLARFFEGIYGSELDGTNADKTHLIAHVLRAESLPEASTVMIGDRAHDINAALANGVSAIGVLWGYGSREELANAGAPTLCERPSELARVSTKTGEDPAFHSALRASRGAAKRERQRTPSERSASNGAEPGGGARGPHRDAPSRNAGGGKEAEDRLSP